jgi:hypothetical protein
MLRKSIVLLALGLCSASAFAAEAGRVVFVVGAAQVASRAAAVDTAVQEGDALSTGADGYIYMKTIDNGFLILRPNSKARVITYRVDAKNPANTQVKFELTSGVARSISGGAVKQARQNFRFNTPVAAIGVRGTDFIVHTNQQSSWVSVVSGGVVMSGFAGACGPEGSGPCEGIASRELFAGRPDTMLQVQRGQEVPQFLQSLGIAPELNTPARSDEPSSKPAATPKSGSAALNDVNLDPAKSKLAILSGPIRAPDVTPVPPVVVVAPPPDLNAKGEILWGRWQSVANLEADAEVLARIDAEASKNQVLVGSYVVARPNNSAFVLPTEGKASFVMAASEATLAKAGGAPIMAQVKDAHLDIDFVSRSYDTGLTVFNSLGKVDMKSSGDVTQAGALQNSLMSPGFILRGLLGGPNSNEAVYTFKTTGTPDLEAAGVVRWVK